MSECVCGHEPWWHRRINLTDCRLCSICHEEERRHGPFGHRFTHCNCKQQQRGA